MRIVLFLTCLLLLTSYQYSRESSDQAGEAMMINARSLTADEILDSIKSHVTCDWSPETVDDFKSGSGDMVINGIATTFMATQSVIEAAAAKGLNMIITHEPTYYNHLDETDFFAQDPVYRSKRAYLDKHDMVVFRFHDHWHRTQPDGIHTGMLRKLGWESFQVAPEEMVFKLPEQSVQALAAVLESHFETSTVRVVGAPDMTVSRVGMAVGSPGSQAQIRMLRRDDVEVLITGETHEWETVEWTRDAIVQGHRKALILLGHADSEEAGMEYCAEWLRTFISEVPIEFIPAKNPLWSPH